MNDVLSGRAIVEHPISLYLFIVSNVAILGGYAFLSIAVAPRYRVRLLATKVGAVGFFALCGLTHLALAYYALRPGPHGHGSEGMAVNPWMVAAHLAQAVFVWVFVTALYVEAGRFGGLDVRPGPAGDETVPEPRRPSE